MSDALDDHSLLVRIDERLDNHIKRVDAVAEQMERHTASSNAIHAAIYEQLTGVRRFQWVWGGGLAVLVFVLTVLMRWVKS